MKLRLHHYTTTVVSEQLEVATGLLEMSISLGQKVYKNSSFSLAVSHCRLFHSTIWLTAFLLAYHSNQTKIVFSIEHFYMSTIATSSRVIPQP